MVKMDWFWSFFAQSQQKRGVCPLYHHHIKIENLAQVFSSEFCKISKNTCPYRTPLVAASAEVYSEACQKFKMVLFAKIVNNWKLLTIFPKASSEMLDRGLNTPLLNTR